MKGSYGNISASFQNISVSLSVTEIMIWSLKFMDDQKSLYACVCTRKYANINLTGNKQRGVTSLKKAP